MSVGKLSHNFMIQKYILMFNMVVKNRALLTKFLTCLLTI